MDKKDILSRRNFFKKAAIAAIPVVGAVALTQVPLVSQAMENHTETGCGGCTGSCSGDCSGTCSTSCEYACDGSCKGGCQNSCDGGCMGDCYGSCRSSSSR